MRPVHIGCSGWQYRDWRDGAFYPPKLPQRRWLEHYACEFETVEVNSTFYRLAKPEAVARWVAETPAGFVLTVKASRYMTHVRRLQNLDEPLARYFEAIAPLVSSGKLGPVLWQLPANFRRDEDRLADALERFPRGRHCFEFRHESWFTDEVYAILRAGGAGLCIHDADEGPTPMVATANLVYVRLRRSAYPKERLDEWRERIRGWVGEGHDVFAYVKHEDNPDAPRLALELAEGLG